MTATHLNSASLFIALAFLSACANQNREKAPDRVARSDSKLSSNERVKLQEKLNSRLTTLGTTLGALDQASQQIGSMVNAAATKDVGGAATQRLDTATKAPTPIGVILELIEAFRGKLPEGVREGKLERFSGRTKIQLSREYFACASTEATLEGYVQGDDGEISVTMGACETGLPLEVLNFRIEGQKAALHLSHENLRRFLRGGEVNYHLPVGVVLDSYCTISLNTTTIAALQCSRYFVDLGANLGLFGYLQLDGLTEKALTLRLGGEVHEFLSEESRLKARVELKLQPGRDPELSFEGPSPQAPTPGETPTTPPTEGDEGEAPVEADGPAPSPSPSPSENPSEGA